MRIAVAGATGAVGSHVVTELEKAGHEVVPLARSTGADLRTGAGLVERLEGVDALIDCISINSMKAEESRDFFTATTTNMIEAERKVGVAHHVVLSIVGIDKVPTGYYQGKVAQERVVREAGQPYTILRATQFHEFAEQMLVRGKVGPFLMAPRMLSAPVAAVEVAQALVELGAGEPHHATIELTGPEQLEMVDMIRAVAKDRGVTSPIIPVPLGLGAAAKAVRNGDLVSKRAWRVGQQTFREWRRERR
ncbi:MAG: SDR family oxidoreductase [Nocardioides sp.]|uniref:SDR family oxidoreductase n=1 Tax=Nocardioides sp. TaxID=35761 RepID=UPI003D6A4D16